jgi:hypothetical protein
LNNYSEEIENCQLELESYTKLSGDYPNKNMWDEIKLFLFCYFVLKQNFQFIVNLYCWLLQINVLFFIRKKNDNMYLQR